MNKIHTNARIGLFLANSFVLIKEQFDSNFYGVKNDTEITKL